MPELPDILAAHAGRGSVLAPAGFGKTHLVAEAVSRSAGRQLVLTHTYAGVNALRRKMRELRVRDALFDVDTIASWALRLCLSYSRTSGWQVERPADSGQWSGLYDACARLLDEPFVGRIVRSSYQGIYVDEYQDCSRRQHGLVVKLAAYVPCRVLGDPLQAIFDFDGQEVVDWERDVAPNFESLGQLETPHRWNRAGRPEIGGWLRGVRERLERREGIDLRNGLPRGVEYRPAPAHDLLRTQGNTCRYLNCGQETAIAIHAGHHEYKAKCHHLARHVSGAFSSIEEIEGKDVFSFVAGLERAHTNEKRLKLLIALSKRCMTSVSESLPAATARGEHADIRANTKNPEVARCGNAYLADTSSVNMFGFLTALRKVADVADVRADLLNRIIGILRKHIAYPALTLGQAAEKYHSEFRHRGRPVGRRKLIGTTLLVKGLEFDHGIVLDAASLSKKELYVALTRGSKSLTIISSVAVLNPA